MRVDGDAEHFAANAAVEALDHAIRLRRPRLGMAVLGAEFGADLGEGGGEAATVVGQHVGEAEGESRRGLTEEGNGALLGLVVLDGEVDRAGAAIDGDIEVALAPFAIGGLQLGQVLDVDVREAEVIVLEGTLAFGGLCRYRLGAAIEAFGLEDAPDAVAVEMRQEMGNDKRQVVEGKVGDPAQRADNGALRLGGLPGQLVRPRRVVQAVCRTTLAPLADGLGGHAIALGEDTAALLGAGDLGPRDGRGAGVRRDLQHRSDRPLSGLDQTFKQVAVGGNSMSHRVPTMFRDLTINTTWAIRQPWCTDRL